MSDDKQEIKELQDTIDLMQLDVEMRDEQIDYALLYLIGMSQNYPDSPKILLRRFHFITI